VELEQAAEVRRLAAALAARQTPDFEAWESLLLQAARQGGAGVLETLLRHWQQHAPREAILCPCGQRMRSRGRRSQGLLTTLGRVPFARSLYQCAPCSQGRFPDDERLDIVQTIYSPGVRRLMARAGSQSQFAQAAEDLRCYAGLTMEAREVERGAEAGGHQVEGWLSAEQERSLQSVGTSTPAAASEAKFYISFDGTGVPVRRQETLGREGKGEDGQARTREIKVGVVFTQAPPEKPMPGAQTQGQEKGQRESRPQRVPGSTRYLTTSGKAQEFGQQLRDLACRQGMGLVALVVFLGDGAAWVWELARVCFPFAKLILDFYHAAEHVGFLTEILFGQDTPQSKAHREAWVKILKDQPDGVDELIRRAQNAMPRRGKTRRLATQALARPEGATAPDAADAADDGLAGVPQAGTIDRAPLLCLPGAGRAAPAHRPRVRSGCRTDPRHRARSDQPGGPLALCAPGPLRDRA